MKLTFNPHLLDIKDFQALQQVVTDELKQLESFIQLQSVEPLLLTSTTDYGLPRWESSMKLIPTGSTDERKANVQSKLSNNQPLTATWLSSKLLSYITSGGVGTAFNIKTDTLTIYFYTETVKSVNLIYDELRNLLPAHLLLKIAYTQKERISYSADSLYREYRKETIV